MRQDHHEPPDRRRGLTLLEMLVAVTMIVTLTGVLLLGAKVVRDSRKRSTAQQQLALISQAIDQYAAFWPAWKVGRVGIAEKGWPDGIAGRLFGPATFETISGFNDDVVFDMEGGIVRPPPASKNPDIVGTGDVLSANVCLAYCLTAGSGKGPYVPPDDTAMLKDIHDPVLLRGFQRLNQSVTNPLLPAYVGGSAAKRAQVFVDPWGTPYRYAWVYRDPDAYQGFLPVDYGAYLSGNGDAGVDNPDFITPAGNRKTAVGYVLESAGPDRKFGNVWQLDAGISGPGDLDVREAADNPTIRP